MTDNTDKVFMAHATWDDNHPGDAAYRKALGHPATCPGFLRWMDDLGSIECDHCHIRWAVKPQHTVQADQYNGHVHGRHDREGMPF